MQSISIRGRAQCGVATRSRPCSSRPNRREALRVVAVGSNGQPKVVVIGGTGRVGSSTATALLKVIPGVQLTLASRSAKSFEDCKERRPDLANVGFKLVDIYDTESVKNCIAGADLVIHTAGPFQRTNNHSVIEAAIKAKVPYIDVCDDTPYSECTRNDYSAACKEAGIPAIISAGIYPGTSNVMAAHMLSIARKEYDDDFNYVEPKEGEGVEPKRLLYSYYTAGSGGAGPTILETSFLLAGEEVIVYKDDKRFELPPISYRREVDFGPGVGRKGVYLYNLPEVESARKYMRVPGVSCRFGTDPFLWNWAMWLMARLMPRHLLNNREFVKNFAKLSDPWVRIIDKIVGEAVAMRIELDLEGGKSAAGVFVHRLLSVSMGYSVAAFAESVLAGNTKPGVWYPEEKECLQDRRRFLEIAATGCERFDLNKAAWALESEPQQIGGLIYW